jgi:hypothetical protein
MWSPPAESSRGAVRWLLPTALLAFAPKCLLCVAAYVGLGAWLGLGGPEICGAPAGSPMGWVSWLALAVAAAGFVVALAGHRSRRATQTVAGTSGRDIRESETGG